MTSLVGHGYSIGFASVLCMHDKFSSCLLSEHESGDFVRFHSRLSPVIFTDSDLGQESKMHWGWRMVWCQLGVHPMLWGVLCLRPETIGISVPQGYWCKSFHSCCCRRSRWLAFDISPNLMNFTYLSCVFYGFSCNKLNTMSCFWILMNILFCHKQSLFSLWV